MIFQLLSTQEIEDVIKCEIKFNHVERNFRKTFFQEMHQNLFSFFVILDFVRYLSDSKIANFL